MSVIREAIVLEVASDAPHLVQPPDPIPPEQIILSPQSADATSPDRAASSTWWMPVDNIPAIADFKRIQTPDRGPGGYAFFQGPGTINVAPGSFATRHKCTSGGIDVAYSECRRPAGAIQIHTYRACDALIVVHQEVVIGGDHGRQGPLCVVTDSIFGRPLCSWYCLVDELPAIIDYVNISLRFEAGQTWLYFDGHGNAPYLRLKVLTAYEGTGTEGVVGTADVVLTGGDKVFPVAMPPVPAGKSLLNAWWTPNDNIRSLYSFLTIWTEVRDGVVYVHQRGRDGDGGPLRICIYACWG